MIEIFKIVWELIKGFFAFKKAQQDAKTATYQSISTQKLSDSLVQTFQLLSFKNANLLRDEVFWIMVSPILIGAAFPNFMHQCVENVIYAIPEKMLWLNGCVIASIFGLGRLKDIFK